MAAPMAALIGDAIGLGIASEFLQPLENLQPGSVQPGE
jgi:hypothetical protein